MFEEMFIVECVCTKIPRKVFITYEIPTFSLLCLYTLGNNTARYVVFDRKETTVTLNANFSHFASDINFQRLEFKQKYPFFTTSEWNQRTVVCLINYETTIQCDLMNSIKRNLLQFLNTFFLNWQVAVLFRSIFYDDNFLFSLPHRDYFYFQDI